MIAICNFEHAHRLYRQGLIPYRLLQEQAMVFINLHPLPGRYITEAFDIAEGDIEWLLKQHVSIEGYDDLLGGNVYVCQSEADLKEIVGMDLEFAESHEGRWPNVTEQVLSWDGCDYIREKSGDPAWAMFLLCWSDAGGPVYYVPKSLWQAAQVAEHIKATHGAWSAVS